MLVSFHKGFMLEGEATFKESLGWFKKEKIRQKIYTYTGISGVCDETELEAEVDRLTNKCLSSSGWGEDFSGWQRVVPYEESVLIARRRFWDTENLPKCELRVTSLDAWTVAEAAKKLTGKQFAQYCRDYDIIIKGDI